MFVNLMAPCNPLGYGVVGYNVLKGLSGRGHFVSYFPIGQPQWDGDSEFQKIVSQTSENAKLYNKDAPCIRIWHQNELDKFVGKGDRIGWPIFELDAFNQAELHQLKNVDRLFVCSEWAKKVCEDNGINIRIDVVPLGVDTNIFFNDKKDKETRPYWTKSTTVFINAGKWEVRKGHNELCEAFSKAFTNDDDVELWMLNHNPFINTGNEQWKRKYISSPMGEKVKILPRVSTQAQLKQLFNHVDCGVFPSHAEGWNLEILELMACGARIIATDYSGHTEFLNKDNALLLDATGTESAQDDRWFHGQGNWCTYDVDQLVEAMRSFHKEKQSGNHKVSDEALKATVDKFTWTKSIEKIEQVL